MQGHNNSEFALNEEANKTCEIMTDKTENMNLELIKAHFLRKAIVESIYTLEATKKSFKSRQLEELRKKLIRVLAETS